MQKINNEKYGLTEEEVRSIKLPQATYLVEIYDISKITNPKSKLSTVEKINHLIKLEEALLNKLQLLREKKITPEMAHQSRNLGHRGNNNAAAGAMRKAGESRGEAEEESDVEEEEEAGAEMVMTAGKFSAQKSTEAASVQSLPDSKMAPVT